MKSLTLVELKEIQASLSHIRATEGNTEIVHLRREVARRINAKELSVKNNPQLV